MSKCCDKKCKKNKFFCSLCGSYCKTECKKHYGCDKSFHSSKK